MILVGSTGLVGSNLMKQGVFDRVYHSIDIEDAYETHPDILIYAGVTGTKFWANKFPDKDRIVIEQAIKNIERIGARKLVLISSVDVNEVLDCDESYQIKESCFGYYGNDRLKLERWVEERFTDYTIIRLPAIYGENLKKNYVHDLICPIPPMLTVDKYNELITHIPEINDIYRMEEDGLFHYIRNVEVDKELIDKFIKNKFNALSFTNPESCFQYYNLSWLWKDIHRIIDLDIKKINLVTEPIYSKDLFESVYNKKSDYSVLARPVNYKLKSKYAELFGGKNGYMYSAEYVFNDLEKFIANLRKREY